LPLQQDISSRKKDNILLLIAEKTVNTKDSVKT
jgi:hypothetical protein